MSTSTQTVSTSAQLAQTAWLLPFPLSGAIETLCSLYKLYVTVCTITLAAAYSGFAPLEFGTIRLISAPSLAFLDMLVTPEAFAGVVVAVLVVHLALAVGIVYIRQQSSTYVMSAPLRTRHALHHTAHVHAQTHCLLCHDIPRLLAPHTSPRTQARIFSRLRAALIVLAVASRIYPLISTLVLARIGSCGLAQVAGITCGSSGHVLAAVALLLAHVAVLCVLWLARVTQEPRGLNSLGAPVDKFAMWTGKYRLAMSVAIVAEAAWLTSVMPKLGSSVTWSAALCGLLVYGYTVLRQMPFMGELYNKTHAATWGVFVWICFRVWLEAMYGRSVHQFAWPEQQAASPFQFIWLLLSCMLAALAGVLLMRVNQINAQLTPLHRHRRLLHAAAWLRHRLQLAVADTDSQSVQRPAQRARLARVAAYADGRGSVASSAARAKTASPHGQRGAAHGSLALLRVVYQGLRDLPRLHGHHAAAYAVASMFWHSPTLHAAGWKEQQALANAQFHGPAWDIRLHVAVRRAEILAMADMVSAKNAASELESLGLINSNATGSVWSTETASVEETAAMSRNASSTHELVLERWLNVCSRAEVRANSALLQVWAVMMARTPSLDDLQELSVAYCDARRDASVHYTKVSKLANSNPTVLRQLAAFRLRHYHDTRAAMNLINRADALASEQELRSQHKLRNFKLGRLVSSGNERGQQVAAGSVGVCVFSAAARDAGTVVQANSALASMLGMERHELEGTRIARLLAPPLHTLSQRALLRLIARGTPLLGGTRAMLLSRADGFLCPASVCVQETLPAQQGAPEPRLAMTVHAMQLDDCVGVAIVGTSDSAKRMSTSARGGKHERKPSRRDLVWLAGTSGAHRVLGTTPQLLSTRPLQLRTSCPQLLQAWQGDSGVLWDQLCAEGAVLPIYHGHEQGLVVPQDEASPHAQLGAKVSISTAKASHWHVRVSTMTAGRDDQAVLFASDVAGGLPLAELGSVGAALQSGAFAVVSFSRTRRGSRGQAGPDAMSQGPARTRQTTKPRSASPFRESQEVPHPVSMSNTGGAPMLATGLHDAMNPNGVQRRSPYSPEDSGALRAAQHVRLLGRPGLTTPSPSQPVAYSPRHGQARSPKPQQKQPPPLDGLGERSTHHSSHTGGSSTATSHIALLTHYFDDAEFDVIPLVRRAWCGMLAFGMFVLATAVCISVGLYLTLHHKQLELIYTVTDLRALMAELSYIDTHLLSLTSWVPMGLEQAPVADLIASLSHSRDVIGQRMESYVADLYGVYEYQSVAANFQSLQHMQQQCNVAMYDGYDSEVPRCMSFTEMEQYVASSLHRFLFQASATGLNASSDHVLSQLLVNLPHRVLPAIDAMRSTQWQDTTNYMDGEATAVAILSGLYSLVCVVILSLVTLVLVIKLAGERRKLLCTPLSLSIPNLTQLYEGSAKHLQEALTSEDNPEAATRQLALVMQQRLDHSSFATTECSRMDASVTRTGETSMDVSRASRAVSLLQVIYSAGSVTHSSIPGMGVAESEQSRSRGARRSVSGGIAGAVSPDVQGPVVDDCTQQPGAGTPAAAPSGVVVPDVPLPRFGRTMSVEVGQLNTRTWQTLPTQGVISPMNVPESGTVPDLNPLSTNHESTPATLSATTNAAHTQEISSAASLSADQVLAEPVKPGVPLGLFQRPVPGIRELPNFQDSSRNSWRLTKTFLLVPLLIMILQVPGAYVLAQQQGMTTTQAMIRAHSAAMLSSHLSRSYNRLVAAITWGNTSEALRLDIEQLGLANPQPSHGAAVQDPRPTHTELEAAPGLTLADRWAWVMLEKGDRAAQSITRELHLLLLGGDVPADLSMEGSKWNADSLPMAGLDTSLGMFLTKDTCAAALDLLLKHPDLVQLQNRFGHTLHWHGLQQCSTHDYGVLKHGWWYAYVTHNDLRNEASRLAHVLLKARAAGSPHPCLHGHPGQSQHMQGSIIARAVCAADAWKPGQSTAVNLGWMNASVRGQTTQSAPLQLNVTQLGQRLLRNLIQLEELHTEILAPMSDLLLASVDDFVLATHHESASRLYWYLPCLALVNLAVILVWILPTARAVGHELLSMQSIVMAVPPSVAQQNSKVSHEQKRIIAAAVSASEAGRVHSSRGVAFQEALVLETAVQAAESLQG